MKPKKQKKEDSITLFILWWLVMGLMLVLLTVGCASGYAGTLRAEHASTGRVVGVYKGQEEYPTVYPASRIALGVEVPTWVYVELEDIGIHTPFMWPIGTTCTIADIGISFCTDTVMLPYDIMQIDIEARKKEKNHDAREQGCQR